MQAVNACISFKFYISALVTQNFELCNWNISCMIIFSDSVVRRFSKSPCDCPFYM